MTIKSGTYVPRTEKVVTHWPLPDPNGNAEDVWVEKVDGAGNIVGRDIAVDSAGRPVKAYDPPAGWRNVRSSDGTDNYVKVDARGNIVRTPDGQAINHKPGRTVVEHPDGSVTYLDDDYSRYKFAQTHDYASKEDGAAEADNDPSTPGTVAAQEDMSEVPDHEMEAFRRWQQEHPESVED